MKKILPFIFLLLPFSSFCQDNSLRAEALSLAKVLERNHYSPHQFNDSLSEKIFIRIFELADPHSLYFMQSDLDQLKAYKTKLDNELLGQSWEFLPLFTKILKERLILADKTFTEILASPVKWDSKEILEFDDENPELSFPKTDAEYKRHWNRWLKYQLLWKMSGSDSISKLPESTLRERVRLSEKRDIHKIAEHPIGYENHIGSLFFNAVTYCFDPHTLYLSKTDYENYTSQLKTENLSFGIDLRENESGDIIIGRLVPGGPAWKTNELHKGDQVVELKWENKAAFDLSGADIYEVEEMLENSNNKKLSITVRKTNGIVKNLTLIKEKIRDDENIVKGYILNGSERRIGYISLPGFYSDWENATGNGCSNDVAKEILKLKEEGVDGIILDIRYNGGGSLLEGISLAGIFIDEGPLMMVRKRDLKPQILKDVNRGTVYDGPLVIMVNGQSASASEVLASTLQDFNRGLIVGSPTYGKATGQVIIPLDTNYVYGIGEEADYNSSFGYLTVTVQKLYRITGKSAQVTGVIPDVYLPDIYEKLNYKEDQYETALPHDSVNKKVVFMASPALPEKELNNKSAARILKNEEFIKIRKILSGSSIQDKMNNLPLEPVAFKARVKEIYDWWENAENAEKGGDEVFKVENTHYDKELLIVDTYGEEINKVIRENLSEDIYLKETFLIMNDLLNLKE